MGKVEKVIVLSVLFLIALILAVSLTVDDPLDKSRVVEAGSTPHTPAVDPSAQPTAPANANAAEVPALASAATTGPAPTTPGAGSAPGLLSMPIGSDGTGNAAANTAGSNVPAGAAKPAEPAAAAAGLPAGTLLKRVDGLKDSILPDMKLYTWQEGDSYRRIADHYYGDWSKFSVLRRSNEGRGDVQPGEQIFVPVFDSDPVVASVPVQPASTPSGKKTTAHAPKKSAPKSVASAPKGTGNKTHVVKNGESLWKIARAELGDGNRWQEIYELNKDVLASEKSVHTGQTLRLP